MTSPQLHRHIASAVPAAPSVRTARQLSRTRVLLLSLLAFFAIGLGSITQVPGGIAESEAAPPAGSWTRISTAAQGQLLTKIREKLESDYGQTAGSYDYSVLKKLRVSGTLNAQDYTDLRNAAYAGTSIEKLDLSGIVDASTQALGGMTALTEVSLPPVGNYNVANPFQGDTSLRHVIVAAETYQFGSATTFNGNTTLQRITFLHTTKPSFNASTFNGSSNADPANRTVTAIVPDKTRGDYGTTAFTQYFSNVVETATADDLAELQFVIDEATSLVQGDAAAEYRWTLLQQAITGAQAVHNASSPKSGDVYRARLILQTAINRIGVSDLGLSLKVTKGAEVSLSWKNGTAQHFAEFTPHPVARVAAFSDNDYDVYVPTVTMPYVTQNVATAVIPGETDKVAKIFTMSAALANSQYTLNLTPLAGREDTALLIPGFGTGDNRGLYTNLDDTGVLNLDVGDHFDLDTIRTQQGQLDQVNNLFIEPDFTFDVTGQSVTTQKIGLEGRRQLRINAAQPGVSVIKITYGPLHYLAANDNGTPGNTNWSFNGIDPQNTGLVVVNVGGDPGTFATGIGVRNELDTYYFDKTIGERDFKFTPAAGTTVRVHDPLNVSPWGTGWRTYDAAQDGSFKIKLKGGRNIVELTNDGKVKYRVVRAKGVDVTVANTTNPGEPFVPGDNARVSIIGVEGGIEKLAGIYNPAFNVGTKAKLTYYDGASELVSNEASQYQTAITTFNINYTYPAVDEKSFGGDMSIGGLGAEWPFHRQIPLEGKPANLAAVAIGPYRMGAMPTVYVYDGKVSTSPGAPGVPTNLQVTYGNGSADASWTAPTVSGGLPVAGYQLRYSSDGGQNWATENLGNVTSKTLSGLTNGTEYEVQVAAFNEEKTGSFSTSRNVTPRTVPGIPSDLSVIPRHESLDLEWTAPNDGGSPLTGYRVRYSSDGGQNWTVRDYSTVTEEILTGLTNGTTYEIQITAINAEGPGAYSASVTGTPEKTGAILGTPDVRDLTTTTADVVVDVDPGDLDQEVTVEYSVNSDHSGSLTSQPQSVTAGAGENPVTVSLTGLRSNTTYYYRVRAEASDGDLVRSAWLTLKTHKVAATVGTAIVADLTNSTAAVSALVAPGDLDQSVTVEYTLQSDHSDVAVSAVREVAGGTEAGDVAISLNGLAAKTEYFYRVVSEASDGDLVASAWSSFRTIADAPKVSLNVDTSEVRAGGTVKLTWTTEDAETIVANGDWTGEKSSEGTQEITLDRAGDFTFSLSTTGEGGTNSASVSVKVKLAPISLTVNAPTRLVRVGRTATVSATGLAAGETYRITIGGVAAGSGVAGGDGSISESVVVPGTLTDGTVPVQVVGSLDDRAGSTSLRVVAAKKLTIKFKKSKVVKGGKQRVTISGLAANEPVRIVYRGRQIAFNRASAKGTFAKTFSVGKGRGSKKVKAFGITNDRTGSRTFKVTK